MRDRRRIEELRAALSRATAEWKAAPQQSSIIAPATCARCGGGCGHIDAELLGLHTPWQWARQFCVKCFPDALGQMKELIECLARQIPRDQRARTVRDYRRSVLSSVATLGPRFAHCWFRTYQPRNESQVQAVAKLRQWLSDPAARDRSPLLMLVGPPGVGKTHLSAAAWRMLARAGQIAEFHNEGQFVAEWHRAHRAYDQHDGQRGATPDELIDAARLAPFLIWDDLGKAKNTDAWGGALYSIIDHRYTHKLPTLVSTNFGAAELITRVQSWTADRILSGACLTIEGMSMRACA